MNKFKFIENSKPLSKVTYSLPCFYRDFGKKFKFSFVSQKDISNVVSDDYENIVDVRTISTKIPGYIVKSEIVEHVISQIKTMFHVVKCAGEQLLYLRMNKQTKDKFRIYYSYEVDHQIRNLSNEDLEIGKVVGSIMGVKIVLDDTVENNLVVPVVRSKKTSSKIQKVFISA